MGALATRINDQQRAFAYAYVKDPDTTANGTQSAIKAGYAADCARQTACRLLQHEGVRAEIERLTRQELGDHASAAVQLLGKVVRDPNAPLKLRIEASKAILDRAGFVAPKAPAAPEIGGKEIEAMSIAELQAFIKEGKEQVAAEKRLVDVTPLAIEAAPTVARSDS